MSDNKKKLSAAQLQQLQQMMMQQGGAGMPNMSQAPVQQKKKISLKGILSGILQQMSNCVKFVDHFIEFVIKKDSDKTNDVVKSARAPIMFGTMVLVFFVFTGIIWAYFAPLDSASHAVGTVISQSQKKTINHLEGGIIKAIYVSLGDKVKKGDRLIEFDSTRVKAQYESLLNQYRSYAAYEARLLAEIDNDEKVIYPQFLLDDKDLPEIVKILKTQNNLFDSNNELKTSSRDSIKQRILQAQKTIEGLRSKKTSLDKTLEVTQDRVLANQQLDKKGFVKKAELLEMEAREANFKSEIAINETEIIKQEQEITRNNIELINFDSKFTADALTQLKDIQIRLSEAKENLFATKDALRRTVVESPVDGVVNNLHHHTIGSTIQQTSPIMDISPTDDRLIIEAKIAPQDIDSIRVGLLSKIRLTAFKSRTTPLFTGEVVSLSPDVTIPPAGTPIDPKFAGGYYIVKIELDMEEFNEIAKTRKLVLQAGMGADIQSVTGTRTLLQYLLDPLKDAMFKGLKEK